MTDAAAPLGPILPPLLAALTEVGVGVAVLGHREGRIEKWYANEPSVRPLRLSVDEWLAKPITEILAPQDRDRMAQVYGQLASGAPLPANIELTFLDRDGGPVRAEIALARVTVPGGPALVAIVRGMGTANHSPMSLLEADRLSLAGAVAAGFAHETNNPLTSVLLNLRALRKQLVASMPDAAQATALRCVDDVTIGAERIASNVRALQTLATRAPARSIDVASVVSAVLRLAAPTLEARAHVIRQLFATPPIVGEESRIAQAVLAMLLFAGSGFDAEPSATSNRIVVAVEARGGAIVIEVSDNGRTLAADEMARAFDPFFHSPIRGVGVGAGLGIARSVASALGGELTLLPRPGGGAAITMRLPLA